MSDSAEHAVWNVVQQVAPAVMAVEPCVPAGAAPAGASQRFAQVSAHMELGSAVQTMLSTEPDVPVAVVLPAAPSALLRLVPHLPRLAASPVVFHVSLKDTSADALMLRQSGLAMLYSSSAAEAEANALVAHLLAARTHTGVVHVFEGQGASCAATKASLADAVPRTATSSAVSESEVEACFAAAAEKLGRAVAPFTAAGKEAANQDTAVVVLGGGAEALAKHADAHVVSLNLVRPLWPERVVALIPESAKRVLVLEKSVQRAMRLPPLLVDLASAFQHVPERAAPSLLHGELYELSEAAGQELAALVTKPSLTSGVRIGSPASAAQAVIPAPKAEHETVYQQVLQELFKERLDIVNTPSEASSLTSPEYALGQVLARLEKVDAAVALAQRVAVANDTPAALALALRGWDKARADNDAGRIAAAVDKVRDALSGELSQDAAALKSQLAQLAPTSRWIIGSDAWAYDSGMGGVHHAMASKRNVNMLVFDTVPYTKRDQVPLHQRKKDIGLYAMNYGGVYVASTALYSDYTQVVQALLEADRFDGPSIVLAYLPYSAPTTPALEVLQETKVAVDSGYWPLYRWDPSAEARGKDVFRLDSLRVRQQLQDFLDRQSHFTMLADERPALAYDVLASEGHALREKQHQKAKEAYDQLLGSLEGPPLLVLFASDGGAAEKVAKRLATRAKLRGLSARVLAMDDFPLEELAQEENVVFVTSTAGQGEPPQNGRLTFKALAKLTTGQLDEKTRFAVFGMGDSHYWPRAEDIVFYNKPAKDLDKRLAEIGASRLLAVGLGDDQDADGWQTGYKAWEPLLWKALGVDSVTVTEAEPEPITNEHIKIASNYLRGTIAEGLADTSTGAICETDTQLTKFHGTYMQFDRDTVDERKAAGLEPAYGFMIRVRMPAGVCTAQQWLQLDSVAEEYGGIKSLKITTRQTVQYHMILKRNMKAAMQSINKSMLDTIAACGDVNRNVMCSPNPHLSEVHEQMYEFSKNLSDYLLPRMNAYHEIWLDKGTDSSSKMLVGGAVQDYEPLYGPYYLPRKFKVAVVMPPRNDVDVFAHDIGLIAIPDASKKKLLGFNLAVGGGMGVTHSMKATYPRLGSVIGFVTVDEANEVCKQVMLIQRDTGNRANRKQARLKYTIDKYWGGADNFRTELERRLGYKLQPAKEFHFDANTDEYGWRKDYRGKWHCTLWLENGRVIDEPGLPFRTGLRELAKFHKGTFRLTPNQHIIVSDIDEADKPRIEEHLREYKMNNWEHSGLRLSASACVAFPTCGLAMAESERYIFKLVDKIERIYLANGLKHDEITMRMTGCPNGCARPWVAEIGFIGKAPGTYVMCLGGGHAGDRLNKIFRDSVGEKEILEIMEVLIPRYAKERLEGEKFGDWVIRAGIIAATTHGAAFYDDVDTTKPLAPAASTATA